MTEILQHRLTNTYVGTYRHMDQWEDIGKIDVLACTVTDEDDVDPCEPQKATMLVCVQCDEPTHPMRIERALRDTYSAHDCAHEYDCCGCRSFSATAHHLSADRYEVVIRSSRNY